MVSAKQFPALLVALALLAAACGSSSDASTADVPDDAGSSGEAETSNDAGSSAAIVSISNDGTTALEGHTPRGFAGSGVGLFAGDNLNPNFPNGEGIQILLTFALPSNVGTPSQATLRSDVVSTSGNAFEALGNLRAAQVEYDAFGPELFNIEPIGGFVNCERPTDSSLTCDVTNAATNAITSGNSSVQIQLTFDELSDNDGEQDLVLFNNGDSNLNESGLFTLELT